MIEEFTASNGVRIRTNPRNNNVEWNTPTSGVWRSFAITNGIAEGSNIWNAIEEWVRAKEDERLGRWRWPENPEYVVYPSDQERGGDSCAWVRVLHEPTSFAEDACRHPSMQIATRAGFQFQTAARAYFDAHPEPKPWHDARPGEVWVITFSEPGGGTTEPWTMNKHGLFEHPNYGSRIRVKDSTIISARKIWPQDEPTIDDLSYDA